MNSNWSYSLETPNLGQIRRFLEPCDLEIWRMTLKNNRAPPLNIIKLYASSYYHMWIQTGVTVRKRLSWVVTSATLTFDLWPWPFAWTSLLSLVIIPENFMMIGWWEHIAAKKQLQNMGCVRLSVMFFCDDYFFRDTVLVKCVANSDLIATPT